MLQSAKCVRVRSVREWHNMRACERCAACYSQARGDLRWVLVQVQHCRVSEPSALSAFVPDALRCWNAGSGRTCTPMHSRRNAPCSSAPVRFARTNAPNMCALLLNNPCRAHRAAHNLEACIGVRALGTCCALAQCLPLNAHGALPLSRRAHHVAHACVLAASHVRTRPLPCAANLTCAGAAPPSS